MGMAAAQARLLSITTRLSDNELRAQIINNDKMRLATESSQASENYITALNEAQYMFSNYDKDSNVSYKKLTYNALTSYNAYNNQYILLNSSGQVIVAEKDAVNFVNSEGDLTKFLKCYNLEEKTSYFDDETHVLNVNDDGYVIYTYFGDTVEEGQNSGFTRQQLEAIFNGTDDKDMIESIKNNLRGTDKGDLKLDGYYNVQSSQLMYNYTKALNNYLFAKDDYNQLIKSSMMEEVNKNVATHCKNNGTKYYQSFNTYEGPESLSSLLSEIDKVDDITNMSTVMGHIENVIIDITNISGYQSGSLDKIQEFLNDNKGTIIETETTGIESNTNSNHIIFPDEDNEYSEDFYMIKNGSQWEMHEIYEDPSSGRQDELYCTLNYDSSVGGYKATETEDANTIIYIYDETNKKLKTQTPNSLQNMKKVAKTVLNYISSNLIDTIINSTDSHWTSVGNSKINDAYNSYKKAGLILGTIIFGIDYNGTSPEFSELDDISTLYNNLANNGNPANFNTKNKNVDKVKDGTTTSINIDPIEIDNFYPIYLNILMDNIMNTYGEPKWAWIDTNNINENGEAKYNWYTNLFNKMNSVGYTILKDGLASSTDWISYAFESGIVTMEQYDKDDNWNPLIYTNCSDITTQTDDIAVAKAEAEYKAAMNKIENKDKRYDLELKNIDTEHNSLQTEYETIKATLDKHIERTFKLYS